MSKWKSRRETRERVLKELVWETLQRFPDGLQYGDLVKEINTKSRHHFPRHGVSQKLKKQIRIGIIIKEPITPSANSYSWRLKTGVTWSQFNIP